MCKSEYESELKERDEKLSGEVGRKVYIQWHRFREEIIEVSEEVCWSRRIREGKGRNASKW